MAEVFRKIKDSNDKDAGQMFISKILPLYVQLSNATICMHLYVPLDSHQYFMTGSLKLFQSLQRGLQAGLRMGEQLPSCRWSDSSLGMRSALRSPQSLLIFSSSHRLGDRHCENILLDTNTGDVVHVDFNCLFEKVRLSSNFGSCLK